jgi:alkaline phosphatase D
VSGSRQGRLLIAAVIFLIGLLLLGALALIVPAFLGAQTALAGEAAEALARVRPATAWQRPDGTRALRRIGVGSCLDQKKPQPIWSPVIAARPDLFLMIGDNVYGDVKSADRRELIEAYATQAAQPELAAARAAFPFLAIWDDHDYGLNDAGAGFAHKAEAAELFHAFWQQPLPRAPGQGIHYSRIVGPAGQRVQIIMLDTRTFRSDLKPRGFDFAHWGKYEPDPDPAKTLLGEAQWRWLETELARPAEIRLLVSSIQVLAEGHGFERWGNLPAERRRLVELIGRTGAKGVILLSGDRHAGALYREAGGGYPLVELTASSLNRPYGPSKDTRIPPLAAGPYHGENFGLLDINWERQTVSIELRDVAGQALIREAVSFAALGHTR